MENYEAVIGLEVHAQLLTRSKMFCACSTAYGARPNTQICPVCLGLPGALPVANERALEFAIRMGLATNCTIANRSVFARKNYFYPDCPKNYQISQYEIPLCSNGFIHLEAGKKRIGIKRIHLEEDAGKLIHSEDEDYSYVDMNRVGVPLIEIVSEPDIRSPNDASLYLQKLRSILMYLDICDGNMEEGSLRCDVNISLRERGKGVLGTKTEIKNLNSFKAVESALSFEIERQEKLLRDGLEVRQDTLLWDAVTGTAQVMRTKEEAHDYRYFPDPDLLLLEVMDPFIDEVRKGLPELPDTREQRFVSEWGLPPYDAQVLTAAKEIAEYFEETARRVEDPKAASNWIMGEVMRELRENKIVLEELKISPERLAGLIGEVTTGRVNMPTAKEIFREMARTGETAQAIISARGLEQISDPSVLGSVVDKVLAGHPDEVAKYLAGKEKLLQFLVGQVMKETKGKAHPKKAAEILRAALEKRR